MTTVHDLGGVLGWPLNAFVSGSHNSMVMALGTCGSLLVYFLHILTNTKFKHVTSTYYHS